MSCEPHANPNIAPALWRDGFAVIRGVFDAGRSSRLADLIASAAECPEALARAGAVYGIRHLLRLRPDVAEFARHPPLRDRVVEIVGDGAMLIQAIGFDKPPGAGWGVPMHRDTVVPVRLEGPSPFTRPTEKAGVPYAQAPSPLLRRMLIARIHIDRCGPANGPLEVVVGSHADVEHDIDSTRPRTAVPADAGDVLLMRPLLIHGSRRPTDSAARRRVVQLVFAPIDELPGARWADAAPV